MLKPVRRRVGRGVGRSIWGGLAECAGLLGGYRGVIEGRSLVIQHATHHLKMGGRIVNPWGEHRPPIDFCSKRNRAESSNVYVRHTGRSNTCKSIDPKERDNSVLESSIDGAGGGSKKAPGAFWGAWKGGKKAP